MNFEINQLRPWLMQNPEGGLKICHAGVLELAAPVMHDGIISAVLFAGPGTLEKEGKPDLVDNNRTSNASRLTAKIPTPQRMTRQAAEQYLEGLRHLAARLRTWREDYLDAEHPKQLYSQISDEVGRKRLIIEHYIAKNYTEPITIESLAMHLHLSVSRTAHLVTETLGKSFGKLLTIYRLDNAARMLWQTEHAVSRIAMDSGFGDISNFHRAFKRRFGNTPLEYRRLGGIRTFSHNDAIQSKD